MRYKMVKDWKHAFQQKFPSPNFILVHQNRRLLSSNYIVMSLMADCYSQAWTKASHHQLKG